MAKPTNNIGAFKGTIDGITYYILNGKQVCRKAAPSNKERIHNDPSYKTVRKNNNEFGGASSYAKAIRNELAPYLNTYKDVGFNNRLTSCCLKIAKNGRGVPGQRSINARNLPEALIGIQLHKKYAFDQQLKCAPRLQQTSKGLHLAFSGMQSHDLKHTPQYANQFKLMAVYISLPEYTWDANTQKYTPIQPEAAPASTHLTTPPIPLSDIPDSMECFIPIPQNKPHRSIPPDPASAAHDPKASYMLWLGIQYGNPHNGQFIPQETGRAMQCISVY